MAQIHGHNAFFALYDAAGASQNLSGNGNDITITETVANLENTGFGANSIQRSSSGLYDFKLSFKAWADDASGNGNMRVFTALKSVGTTFCMAPGGSGTATASPIKYTGCIVVDDSAVSTPVAGLVTVTATMSERAGSLTSSCSWSSIF